MVDCLTNPINIKSRLKKDEAREVPNEAKKLNRDDLIEKWHHNHRINQRSRYPHEHLPAECQTNCKR